MNSDGEQIETNEYNFITARKLFGFLIATTTDYE